ncbi:helix-turn-helix domain-containing protein [Thermaerobacillus caldiproteolyticus]|uniref:helix-turn-helix domain-containing protein n=1 Tax=Thermaerobacillus caldiproteolyticus TaxID=247480 RepID=UPI002867F1A9|nr:helix-turn-helix domain-containing protein [Anoxybacillus caldiproteolyticus]
MKQRCLKNGLRILHLLSTSKPELGITETSNSDGLNKSTVHRLMKTLEKEGFVLKEIKRRANISWGFHF